MEKTKIASRRQKPSRVLERLQEEVAHRNKNHPSVNYNERYIDGGPAWGEHINYADGGQHGQTHRPK